MRASATIEAPFEKEDFDAPATMVLPLYRLPARARAGSSLLHLPRLRPAPGGRARPGSAQGALPVTVEIYQPGQALRAGRSLPARQRRLVLARPAAAGVSARARPVAPRGQHRPVGTARLAQARHRLRQTLH